MTTEVTPRPTGRGSRGAKQSARPATVSSGRRQRNRASAVLMAPFFLLLAMVFVAPLLTALWMSFFAQDSSGLGFGPVEQSFVGLRSYTAVLGDPTFMGSLGLILIFCLVYIPIVTAGALSLALLMDSGLAKLRSVMQMGLFLPHAVPGIIAAIIWLYLYTPGISPITEALGSLNLEIDFLSVNLAVPAVVKDRKSVV